jgi:hypothetical protein
LFWTVVEAEDKRPGMRRGLQRQQQRQHGDSADLTQ